MEQPELGGAAFTGSSTNEEVEQLLGDAPAQPEPEETEPEVEVVTDQPVTIETTDEVTETPQAQEEAPVEEEPPADEPPEATPEEKEQAKKYLGMFETPEELEAFALTLRQNESRRGNELHQTRQELEQTRGVLNEVAEKIRNNPRLQALLQGQEPQPEYNFEDADLSDPQTAQQFIDRRVQQLVEQRLAEAQGQWTQQQTQAQQAAQRERMLGEAQAFLAAHPDAADGTPINAQMASLTETYMKASEGDWVVDGTALNAVYELAKDPQLAHIHNEFFTYPDAESLAVARELKDNPRYYELASALPEVLERPAGREWAKKMSQQFTTEQVTAAQTQAKARQQETAAAALKAATVETGGNGAPVSGAPGDRPKTEMDDIYDAAMAKKESIFFQ